MTLQEKTKRDIIKMSDHPHRILIIESSESAKIFESLTNLILKKSC